MKKHKLSFSAVFVGVIVALFATTTQAQDEPKADKTGTNPVNFTFDARLYNEFTWLNTDGDGEQNNTTFEFRAPILAGKVQFRARGRIVDLEVDTDDDGVNDVEESGIGDIDFRFLAVPYLNMPRKLALAVGFETVLNTAVEDALGSGVTVLGPQAFLVFFNPLGIPGLFAPAYQHKFSIDEDPGRSEICQGLIDLNFLYMFPSKKFWFFADPQIVLDYEEDKEYGIVDLELGAMLDPYFGSSGQSVYLRPSFGVGQDRATDGSIEVGFKALW
jgi:hypothetical protein